LHPATIAVVERSLPGCPALHQAGRVRLSPNMSQVTEKKRAFVRKGRKEERKKNDGRGECHTVQSTIRNLCFLCVLCVLCGQNKQST
jgi:hypothetical protein